ncbi:hypothetical protein VCR15J2_390031 [Vibrio coralliirubri]|uniref:hypothetical protein n=1 Tax=Vibrio coralliirubri TaxID=1516159 RepID=UPI000632712F|nr:hypothetical protein [Vibrio coralliirubri]CDT52952.1 hypothetical protein VCR15J2_390031 [Vibrio coralliirubri]
MHKSDIEYGQVLLTGEIAFYLQHPKGRLITEKNKAEFLKKWIGRRLKQNIDNSAVKKCLKAIRNDKRIAVNWTAALDVYNRHVKQCRKFAAEKTNDRQLLDTVVKRLDDEGYCVKENVQIGATFNEAENIRHKNSGAFLVMEAVNQEFEDGTVPTGRYLRFLVTSKNVMMRSVALLEDACFPVQCTEREGIIAVRSAQEHIGMVLGMLGENQDDRN